jgi:hypothetical protein
VNYFGKEDRGGLVKISKLEKVRLTSLPLILDTTPLIMLAVRRPARGTERMCRESLGRRANGLQLKRGA